MTNLTPQQVDDAHLVDWHGGRPLKARFRTGDFAAGLAFVNAVGEAAEAANHHPDITLTYDHVDLTLESHDVGAITERDIQLARVISGLAAERSIPAAQVS